MLRATVVYIFIALYVLVMAPIGMIWTHLSGKSDFIYRVARFCIRIAGWMAGVRVVVHHAEKIQTGQNYVFLSNHRGNFDGPVLLHTIPRDVRALVKMEMMRIPVLAWIMRQIHFVPIDRFDPGKARSGIAAGARLLEQGFSFIAFPEGTRSRDGRLGQFKKGVFLMALQARIPIMPISILGSSEVQPPGAYAIRPGTIEVIFHNPIPTDRLAPEDRDRLMERTREAITSALPEKGSRVSEAWRASSL